MATLSDNLQEKRTEVLVTCGIVTAIISLLAGLSHTYWSIWAAGIVMSLALFIMAFHKVWSYIFWIGAIYLLSAYAMFSYFPLAHRHWSYKVLAAFSELVALFILINLLRKTIRLRNSTADNYYTPIGIWTIVLFAFYILSNLSIYCWYTWAIGDTSLNGYIAAEILLILMFGYLLWVPENFGWEDILTAIAIEDGGKRKCPICNGALKRELKACPKCGKQKAFLWCPRCEQYEVRCHSCNKLTHYGEGKCHNCDEELGKNIICGNCSARAGLSQWK
jgi:hypothetical protein